VSSTDPEDLADRIGDMLAAVRRAMRSGRQIGDLAPRQEAALAWLRRRGHLTTAELARYEQITPQSMGAVVAELVERGFAVKTRDPNDGRRELLAVTEAGLEAVGRTDAGRRTDLVQLLATRLSAPEREAVARGLELLMKIEEGQR
jgi:DNA-binding MarR family transcriptional regulator